ncbi:hypothetical protein ACFLT2_13250 [Acidobacteriota bacterium]
MIQKAACCSGIFLLCILISSILCCKSGSPESPEASKTASLEISIDNEPVLLTYNWNKSKLEGKINITLFERNGVGCNVDSIDVYFLWLNSTYEPMSCDCEKLNPYGSFKRAVKLSTEKLYEGIRISVKGIDDNGHSVSKSEDFSLEDLPGLKGNYKGQIAGTQLGWMPFTSTIYLNIEQDGKNFSGNWSTALGTSGTFEASFIAISEDEWEFEMDATQYNPGYGEYAAEGKITEWGRYLIGSFKGSSGDFGEIDATFSAGRR